MTSFLYARSGLYAFFSIHAFGLLMSAGCHAEECHTQQFPLASIEVRCSTTALEEVTGGSSAESYIVEYRKSGDAAWIECGASRRFAPLCASEEAPRVVHCFGSAGESEFRVRQGRLVSETVVATVQDGVCTVETEEFSVTLTMAE